jgi:GAF domain-containing protein
MTVDLQVVARTISELRARLPEADDLLEGLQHLAQVARTVVGVDGAGLTLVHEEGPPRWVAATDAVMELLERIQQDFGEGPYLQAYSQDRAVAVEDLRTAPAWSRIAAVVGQLRVCGVLSVPVRLAGQPVGTLDAYTIQPRAWSVEEVEAVGAFAEVAADLIRTAVQLATRDLEVAQLQQALTNRVWVEQAKGVLAATQGLEPEAAFQQLRATARSASRKLAEVAQEVVQDAQRQRLAAVAEDDARVRAVEARAEQAEAALEAAQAGLARRAADLDRAQRDLDARERAADARNHAADELDRIADERDQLADAREQAADDRDRIADERQRVAEERDRTADHQN